MGIICTGAEPHFGKLQATVHEFAALHRRFGSVVSLLDTFQETIRITDAFTYLPSIKHVFRWTNFPILESYSQRPDKLTEIGRELTLACYEADEALTALSLLRDLEVDERSVRLEAYPVSPWVTRWGNTIDPF